MSLDNIACSFAILEPTSDETGKCNGWYYRQFSDHTGTISPSDRVGKHVPSDIHSIMEQKWFNCIQQVLVSGYAKRCDGFVAATGKHYDSLFFPAAAGHIGVLFTEVNDKQDTIHEIARRLISESKDFVNIISSRLREHQRHI